MSFAYEVGRVFIVSFRYLTGRGIRVVFFVRAKGPNGGVVPARVLDDGQVFSGYVVVIVSGFFAHVVTLRAICVQVMDYVANPHKGFRNFSGVPVRLRLPCGVVGTLSVARPPWVFSEAGPYVDVIRIRGQLWQVVDGDQFGGAPNSFARGVPVLVKVDSVDSRLGVFY